MGAYDRDIIRLHPDHQGSGSAPGQPGAESRLADLSAAHALGDLDPSDRAELEGLIGSMGERSIPNFERTIGEVLPAIAARAGTAESELPQQLFTKMKAEGEAMVDRRRGADALYMPGLRGNDIDRRTAGRGRWLVGGWITAAAGLSLAALFAARFFKADDDSRRAMNRLAAVESESLAVKAARDSAQLQARELQRRLATADSDIKAVQEQLRVATAKLSTAEQLAQLLLNSDNTVLAWAPGGDSNAAGLQGQVVWNTRLQQGFMRFKGLKVNDPGLEQYQAWIFDGGRDITYPVDAGVFDIASVFFDTKSGDYIVPIEAKLAVKDPKVFAVTVERPGGVVVTKKERIVALAQ